MSMSLVIEEAYLPDDPDRLQFCLAGRRLRTLEHANSRRYLSRCDFRSR